MAGLDFPECSWLVDSVKKDTDLYSKAKDLDDKRSDLLKINKKLETGQITDKRCLLYDAPQIHGLSDSAEKMHSEIEKAFTTNMQFHDYSMPLKTIDEPWGEAARDYLDRYYPTEGVFLIPPLPEYDDDLKQKKESLNLFSENKVVKHHVAKAMKEMEAKRGKNEKMRAGHMLAVQRAKEAQSEILIAFEKWGRDTKQNMFIFRDFAYSDIIKKVFKNFKKPVGYHAEFDVLIMSEQLGIISVEVKGVGGHSFPRVIHQGWRQIMNANFFLREMNNDLKFFRRLPFKGFVGLPFLSRRNLNDERFCRNHQRYLICKEDVSRLPRWLHENHFSDEYERKAMSQKQFRELAARFASLATVVITNMDTAGNEMCKFLTPNQNSVIQNPKQHAVLFGDHKTGKTLVLTNKAISLASTLDKTQDVSSTGSQAKVVHIIPCYDVSEIQFDYGANFSDQNRGIGKFVKLEDKKKENIKIYKSFRDFYVTATQSLPDPNKKVDISMVIEAVENVAKNVDVKASTEKEWQDIPNRNFAVKGEYEVKRKVSVGEEQKKQVVHHFFFDKFPLCPLKGGALEKLWQYFLRYLRGSYLWISVDTDSVDVSLGKNPSTVLGKELLVESGEGVLLHLKDIMIPVDVFRMNKKIEILLGKGYFEHSNINHMLKGVKPRLFRLPSRKCEVFGNNLLGCECQVANLASTLGRTLDSVVDKVGPLSVTILIEYVMSTPMSSRLHALLKRAAQVLDIELKWNTVQSLYTEESSTMFTDGVDLLSNGLRSPCPAEGNEPSKVKKPSRKLKIQVVDQRTFLGCETSILIFIDPFGMRHWFKGGKGKAFDHSLFFTQCAGHVILITWPDVEAKQIWNQQLLEFENKVKNSGASVSSKQEAHEYINTARGATENFLQILLDENLIINMDPEQTTPPAEKTRMTDSHQGMKGDLGIAKEIRQPFMKSSSETAASSLFSKEDKHGRTDPVTQVTVHEKRMEVVHEEITANDLEQAKEAVCQSFLERKGTITKTGGMLEIPGTGVVLTVPPNALPEHMEKCEMHIRIIPKNKFKEQVASFSSNSTTSVELLPDGLSFQRPVRLSLPHCLVLRQTRERKARIFVSHHKKGSPPNWKEHTNLSYHLEDTFCVIFLNGFCWVKYSINDEIVEGKKLVVYTAARKLRPLDRVAEVRVGYYFDLPEEQKILRDTRDLTVAHRKTLFFLKKEEKSKHPLVVDLNTVFPGEWQCSESISREITYTKIETDERSRLLYRLQTADSRAGSPLCAFTVSQRNCRVSIQLAVYLRVIDPSPSGISTSRDEQSSMKPNEDTFRANMTIGKTGGTLKIKNTDVQLEIPANALPPDMDECEIWMRIIPSRIVEEQVKSLCSTSSTAVELYPSNLTLQHPVKLILPHCLQFEENTQPTARIFTNNEIGSPSYWQETQAIKYEVKKRACIVYLQTFICVKYAIDDEGVQGKNIRLYTAAKDIKQNDKVAEVEVGYYPDIPVGEELLRLNPNFKVDSKIKLLFMKEENVALQLSLDTIFPPEQWEWLAQRKEPQEIPGTIIASSIEHSYLYILQRKEDQCGSTMCHFNATQGGYPDPEQISIALCPEEDRSIGNLQIQQTDPMLVTFEFLSQKLGFEWVDVAKALGIPNSTQMQLKEDNPHRTKDVIYQMLLQWKQGNGKQASYDVLLLALDKAGRKDLVEKVQKREEFS